MRIGIGLVIVGAVVAGIVMDRHREKPAAPPPAVAASVAAPVTSPRQASEHNWPKSALDRVADVKRQVAEKRKEEGR